MILIFGWPLASMCSLSPIKPIPYPMPCAVLKSIQTPGSRQVVMQELSLNDKSVYTHLAWCSSLSSSVVQWGYNTGLLRVCVRVKWQLMWACYPNSRDPWGLNIHACYGAEISDWHSRLLGFDISIATLLTEWPWASCLISLISVSPSEKWV